MENIGVVVHTNAKIGLGGRIIPFLKGVDENVYERLEHKNPQKQKSRQKIQPSLPGIELLGEEKFHAMPPSDCETRFT